MRETLPDVKVPLIFPYVVTLLAVAIPFPKVLAALVAVFP